MKNILKSHLIFLVLAISLLTIVIFQALKLNQCLEIKSKYIELKASCSLSINKDKEMS